MKNLKNKIKIRILKNKRGFSLIELMVVIAIIGIMTTVSMVSLQKSKDKKAVDSAVHEVAANLHATKNYALSGKNACSECPNFYTFSYGINSGSKSSGYEIAGPGSLLESYSVKDGVVFVASNNLSFSAPWAGPSIVSTRAIVLQKGTYNSVVCVYPSGNIVEVLSSTNCPE